MRPVPEQSDDRARASRAAAFALVFAVAGILGAQTSAPAETEAYERTLREERVQHAERLRRLREEEDRLRTALDSARARLAEAEARQSALSRLAADVERGRDAVRSRLADARDALDSVRRAIVAAADRLTAWSAAPPGLRNDDLPLARRVRLLFQELDRRLLAARAVSVSSRERNGALGHEVRLGRLATFFVPASGAAALIEPSGRALPAAIDAALREIVRQASSRGRGALVRIPWWGGS